MLARRFLAATGDGDSAGLLYGVMGIGSAALALGSAALPSRFTPKARWLVFGSLLLVASIGYATARSETGLLVALGILGFGIGPTLVALYSLAAALSPAGRSATTMTMLGSAVIVGQALASAGTGVVVDSLGATAALAAPALAAALVVAAGLVHPTPASRPVEQPELVRA